MKQTRKTAHGWTRLTALVLALALLLAGCAGQTDNPANTGASGTESSGTEPTQTQPTQTQPAQTQPTQQLSAEDQALLQRTGLLDIKAVDITDADAQQINAAVAGMRAAYVAGPGGEDPLVVDRNWSAYASSLAKENLSRREAEFYNRLDKLCLGYLSTSGLDGTQYKCSDGSLVYATEGVAYDDLGLSTSEARAVYYWFKYNHPEYYFLKHTALSTSSSLFPCLFESDSMLDGEKRAKVTNELFDKLDGWIKTVEANATTTYQKELYANNLICETVTYNHESLKDGHEDELDLCQSLYSVVILEDTVCAGYAEAFCAMMNAMNVDAVVAISNTHAWNVVQFDNGNYYAVDVCWNDTDKASPAYKNDYMNVGTAGWTTPQHIEHHTYQTRLTSWTPAIPTSNYTPTSDDTNAKPVDKTAVKTPKVEVAETGGTAVRFALDNADERIVVRRYADAEHKFRLSSIASSAKTDYTVAGLAPSTTYYFGFLGRKTVDGQNYYSDEVYLTVTTAADDSAVNIQYNSLDRVENVRVTKILEDGVTFAWDSIDGSNIYYVLCAYSDSKHKMMSKVLYSGSETSYTWTGLTKGTTYYFGIMAFRLDSHTTVYSVWHNYYYEFKGKTPDTSNYETKTYDNGNVYYGELKDGQPNGNGKMTFANGHVYEGEWKNGKIDGYGKYTWTNDVYEGEWKDGKRDGYGKYTWADGNVYEGEWKDGGRTGYGQMTYTSGTVYEGEWKEGKYHGHGVYYFASGAVYDGEWKDGKQHGHGTYTWADGNSREGEWEDGQFVSWDS